MVGVSKEVVSLIFHLLPGFLTAWIFYGLTAHPKRSPFERAVQALIFTALVRVFVVAIESTVLFIGEWKPWTLGKWTENTSYVWSIFLAILLGHVLAYFANKNIYHALLNSKFDLTQRTSYPSEWFSAFTRYKNYIILHLAGGRRVYGWPNEWPDHPDAGHFVLQEPSWLLEDNTEVPIVVDEFMLIPAADVEMVEFLKNTEELEGQENQIESSQKVLVELQKKKPISADQKDENQA